MPRILTKAPEPAKLFLSKKDFGMKTPANAVGESSWQLQNFFHFPLAAVLLAAGLLKLYELSQSPDPSNYLLGSRLLTISAAAAEVVLALWVFVSDRGESAKKVLLILFSLFLAYSIHSTLTGKESCGCFGAVHIPPRVMVFFDVAGMALAFFWVPKKPQPKRIIYLIQVCLLVPTAFLVFSSLTLRTIEFTGDIDQNNESVVFLKPRKWLGEMYPLRDLDVNGSKCLEGEWWVLIHRPNCASCKKTIRHLYEYGHQKNLNLLSISGSHGLDELDFKKPEKWLCTSLPATTSWFAVTPVLLKLSNGKVSEIHTKPSSEELKIIFDVNDAVRPISSMRLPFPSTSQF